MLSILSEIELMVRIPFGAAYRESRRPMLLEKLHDLPLGEVMPFVIGIGNREKNTRTDIETEDFIHLGRNELDGALGSGGNGHDNPARFPLLNEVNRCHHGIPRGQAIVHHNDDLAPKIGKGASTAKHGISVLDILQYRDAEFSNLFLGKMKLRHEGVVEEETPLEGEGAKSGLRIPGNGDLPGNNKVEGKFQMLRDPEPDWNAARWDGKDQAFLTLIFFESPRKTIPRLQSISEDVGPVPERFLLDDFSHRNDGQKVNGGEVEWYLRGISYTMKGEKNISHESKETPVAKKP
jgi:hypothetical protein